jgi:glutamate/tyrosine decarboxylase-like PLP-dependent enzyme
MTIRTIYEAVLQRTLDHALHYLDSLDVAKVSASRSLEMLRQRLDRPLEDDGIPAIQVIDELVSDAAGGVLGSAGGRFFGWVIGGSLPAALAADWLTSTWDQNAATFATAPAVTVIEEVTGKWLKDVLGLPSSATFAFTTGSQLAHVSCLAAARNALLSRSGWDVERKGLMGAPPLRVLSTNQRHGSIERAVRLLGIGSDHVADLAVDAGGRMVPPALADALGAEPGVLAIVCLQAGDLNIGAFDPFAELVPLAHQYGAWVHVDGAFGLWANASADYRHLLNGIEQADSWATDGHKWLNVPYDSGYAFVAHADAQHRAVVYQASYSARPEGVRNPIDWTPEWSRRARGVATYAALRQLGRKGIAELVERTCRHAHLLVTEIGRLPSAELVWEPQVNQGLVRFLSSKPNATEADHDARTDQVIANLVRSGEAFFGGTTWREKRCMRISVCNWLTSDSDVERVIDAVAAALEG